MSGWVPTKPQSQIHHPRLLIQGEASPKVVAMGKSPITPPVYGTVGNSSDEEEGEKCRVDTKGKAVKKTQICNCCAIAPKLWVPLQELEFMVRHMCF
jgi:hypothetical protein